MGKGQIDSVGISMLGGIPLGAFYGISVVRASPFWSGPSGPGATMSKRVIAHYPVKTDSLVCRLAWGTGGPEARVTARRWRSASTS